MPRRNMRRRTFVVVRRGPVVVRRSPVVGVSGSRLPVLGSAQEGLGLIGGGVGGKEVWEGVVTVEYVSVHIHIGIAGGRRGVCSVSTAGILGIRTDGILDRLPSRISGADIAPIRAYGGGGSRASGNSSWDDSS